MAEGDPAEAGRSRLCLRWFVGVSILAVASAAAWLLLTYMEAPRFAACLLTVAIGLVLYRLARVNTVGIAFWCAAVTAMIAAFQPRPSGNEDGLVTLCFAVGWLLAVASGIVFLFAAVRDRTHRGRNCACCNLALFPLIAWIACCVNINSHYHHRNAVERTTETLLKLHKLGNEIESIRARLGRLPENEQELVALRGKPMPTFYNQYQITYHRLDDGRYTLHCSMSDFWGYAWDIFGWIVLDHGPDSPRRLQVIPF